MRPIQPWTDRRTYTASSFTLQPVVGRHLNILVASIRQALHDPRGYPRLHHVGVA